MDSSIVTDYVASKHRLAMDVVFTPFNLGLEDTPEAFHDIMAPFVLAGGGPNFRITAPPDKNGAGLFVIVYAVRTS